MVKTLKCKVEECIYNDHFNCTADAVEVCSSGTNHVTTSDNTACSTFTLNG